MKKINILLFFVFLAFISAEVFAKEVLTFNALYKIPTDTKEDTINSTFKLENYQVTTYSLAENKASELSYTLPSEMVGNETQINLQVVAVINDVKYLNGEKASAKCVGPWKEMKCEMRFHDLSIDLELIEQRLNEIGYSENDIKSKIQIISKFSGDPIGITEVISTK